MRRVIPTAFPPDPLCSDAASLGAAIRAARTSSGLTLVEAAMVLGISKQTLSDLETGTGTVNLATALRAAHELGVSVFAVGSEHREPVRRLILQETSEGPRQQEPGPPTRPKQRDAQ